MTANNLACLRVAACSAGSWLMREMRINACAKFGSALVAARSNQQFKAFYQRLRLAGKPAKVALLAVARKLLTLLNAALKNPKLSLAD